jgi:hypothetical protein
MQKGRIAVQDFLARMPLFNELSNDELNRIAQGATRIRSPASKCCFIAGISVQACMPSRTDRSSSA